MPGQPGQSPPVLISPPKKIVFPSNARNPYPTKNDGANPTRNVQTPNPVIPTKLCHPDRNRSSQSDDLWSGGTLCLMFCIGRWPASLTRKGSTLQIHFGPTILIIN